MTPVSSWWAVVWAAVMIGVPVFMMVTGMGLSEVVAFPVAILSPCAVAGWRFLR